MKESNPENSCKNRSFTSKRGVIEIDPCTEDIVVCCICIDLTFEALKSNLFAGL